MLNKSKIFDGLASVCAGLAVVTAICLAAMAYSLTLIIYDQPFPDSYDLLHDHLNLYAILWVVGVMTAVLTWVWISTRRARKVHKEESERAVAAETEVG